jgi:FkbM family methyltransferase
MFYRREYDLSSFHHFRSVNLLYKDILNEGKIPFIVDAGANIGASVVFFALEFPDCRIIAIEPESNNCAMLRQNCAGLNYRLIEGGVGCENGGAFLTDTGRGDLTFTLSEKGSYPVRVHSLTDIIQEQIALGGLPLIIKIDIEGGEADLFRASTNWLTAIPLLIIELHDWMLPGKGVSRNFLRAISNHNFDFVYQGENVFCFNNDALCEFDRAIARA